MSIDIAFEYVYTIVERTREQKCMTCNAIGISEKLDRCPCNTHM